MSHIFSLLPQSLVSEMSQHWPAADTHSHYQSRPIIAHEWEEAICDFDDLHVLHVGSIVERAGKQQPPPPPHTEHARPGPLYV